jgi:hypothetical protein
MAFTWQTLAAVENSTLQNEQYHLRPAQKAAAFTIYEFFLFFYSCSDGVLGVRVRLNRNRTGLSRIGRLIGWYTLHILFWLWDGMVSRGDGAFTQCFSICGLAFPLFVFLSECEAAFALGMFV